MKGKKKQPEQETDDEVVGYDQGKDVEFADDSASDPREQAQPEHGPGEGDNGT